MNKNNTPENQNNESPEQENSRIEFPSREELENQLTGLEAKIEDYKNAALRAQAELENVRRRATKDVENAHKFGIEKLLNELLPVLDSLTRALGSSAPRDPQMKSMHDGIQLTLGLLEKTLTRHGVHPIAPKKGDPFNPERHEAMSTQSDPDAKPHTILEVLQKGFELNGRVLRPAMVIVAS